MPCRAGDEAWYVTPYGAAWRKWRGPDGDGVAVGDDGNNHGVGITAVTDAMGNTRQMPASWLCLAVNHEIQGCQRQDNRNQPDDVPKFAALFIGRWHGLIARLYGPAGDL